jgi:hypothetical protein
MMGKLDVVWPVGTVGIEVGISHDRWMDGLFILYFGVAGLNGNINS